MGDGGERTPARFIALDGLRGVCACFVTLFHFKTTGVLTNLALFRHAWLFVDFFFVLSGFVIAASYDERLTQGFSVGRFMGLRLGRVYPLHLAVLLLYVALELLLLAFNFGSAAGHRAFTGNKSVESLALNLGLLQIFGIVPYLSWNQPSWSIAAEVWTYLIFALVCRYLTRWRLAVLGMGAVVGLLILILTAHDREWLNATYSGAIYRCVYGFGIGVLLHAFWARRRRDGGNPGYRFATAAELFACAVAVGYVSLLGDGPMTIIAPIIFALVILAFVDDAGAVSRLLARPFFILLGTLSYSIYMIHTFVQGRIVDVLQLAGRRMGGRLVIPEGGGHMIVAGPAGFADLLTFVMVAAVIAAAWLSYRLVEQPGRRWSRRMLLSERPRRERRAEQQAPTF